MRAFQIEAYDGFEATIFAKNREEASRIFRTHYQTYMGTYPVKLMIAPYRRLRLEMPRRHLAEAKARKISGVGYHVPGRGWAVIAPDLVVVLVPQPVGSSDLG
ncbi:hypothetical protein [Sphingomonas sp. S2-65]|uniref:hypothetical protein n=1 Tax=Sphingomonas sp. S2-65 TaxID=2903960 RepID=UPI001F1A8BA2|nr:hypothetical protein [Sphingomonas sp. S2-65]UYY59743.1 hypothetical protein LZ586_06565 [Sphingomonas sp. S2-65]